MTADLLGCGNDDCGAALIGRDPRPGRYSDGEAIVCSDCGATNHVSVDDQHEKDGACDIYVSSWHCVHGRWDHEPCDDCVTARMELGL